MSRGRIRASRPTQGAQTIQAADQSASEADDRESRVQDAALALLCSFGVQIGGGTGYVPEFFMDIAFTVAESFVTRCEQREAAQQGSRVQSATETASSPELPAVDLKIEPAAG